MQRLLRLYMGLAPLLLAMKDKTIQSIHLFRAKARQHPITLKQILTKLSGKGRALIIILLSLPQFLPIPLPGIGTITGIVLIFFGSRIAFEKTPWLPKALLKKTISYKIVKKITNVFLWLYKKFHFLTHPRIFVLSHSRIARVFNGVLIIIMGILLINPIFIPFVAVFHAFTILFMGVGLLEEDGIFIICSYVFFILTVLFYMAMYHHFLRP